MKLKKLLVLTTGFSALALTSALTVVSCSTKKEPVEELSQKQYQENLQKFSQKFGEGLKEYGEKENYNRDEIVKIINEAKSLVTNKTIKPESEWTSEKADKIQKALNELMKFITDSFDTIIKELPKTYDQEKLNQITAMMNNEQLETLARALMAAFTE